MSGWTFGVYNVSTACNPYYIYFGPKRGSEQSAGRSLFRIVAKQVSFSGFPQSSPVRSPRDLRGWIPRGLVLRPPP
ncbi:MAG: hypothetical protein IPJ85_18105 [Flavobacteriales bacterium]|nr:hypothetical protein [Flavobacteriales bacterium]